MPPGWKALCWSHIVTDPSARCSPGLSTEYPPSYRRIHGQDVNDRLKVMHVENASNQCVFLQAEYQRLTFIGSRGSTRMGGLPYAYELTADRSCIIGNSSRTEPDGAVGVGQF